MSVDYENRARIFATNIQAGFRELGNTVKFEAEDILENVIAAYTLDLKILDAKTRVLDDIIAIANIGDAPPEQRYRKIEQVLIAKELIATNAEREKAVTDD